MTALWDNDALTLAGMLRGREVSAREVIAAHMGRIEAVDGAVNAVVTRCFEQAMAKARGCAERRHHTQRSGGSRRARGTGARDR